MSYHGGPHDSLMNAISRAHRRWEKRHAIRKFHQNKRRYIAHPEAYAAAIEYNKAHDLEPHKQRIDTHLNVLLHRRTAKKRSKPTLPRLHFMEPKEDNK